MGASEWTVAANSQTTDVIRRGPTSGEDKPSGGGTYTYGFVSQDAVVGGAALWVNDGDFAPMASGGSVRAAMKRKSGTAFAPFIFMSLQSDDVGAVAYLMGLADSDPAHIVIKKGTLSSSLPDLAPDAPSNGILLRSTEAFENDTWVHVRLDVLVQGTGDVIVRGYINDLDANPVTSPVWTTVPGMEGGSPTGFVDDVLGVNSGSLPLVGGRGGFGFESEAPARAAYFDQLQIARQT